MCFVGERRATARVAPTQKIAGGSSRTPTPTQKSRSAYKRVVEDADPYEKTRAASGVGVLMLTGPLQKGGDQQENEAHPLKDEPENCGADNEKGGTDDDKA